MAPERVNIIYYGGWKHNGIHVIDTLNFLFSDEIKWTKINNVLMSPYPKDPTIEISGNLKIKLELKFQQLMKIYTKFLNLIFGLVILD